MKNPYQIHNIPQARDKGTLSSESIDLPKLHSRKHKGENLFPTQNLQEDP